VASPIKPPWTQTKPQTWNRYAYVGNGPLGSTDPLGLVTTIGGPCGRADDCGGDGGGGGGGECDPSDPLCVGGCDIFMDPFCDPGGGGAGGGGGGGGGVGGGGGGPQPGGGPSGGGAEHGLWPENRTFGLPGLSAGPLNLGGLLGLNPNGPCDFGVCNPIGFGFQNPEEIAVGWEAIKWISALSLLLYDYWWLKEHPLPRTVTVPKTDWEICYLKLDNERQGGSGFHNCWYQCEPSKRVIKRVQYGKCDPYTQSF